jgi:hypothetical protein
MLYRLLAPLELKEIQAHLDRLSRDEGGWVDLRGREFLLSKLRIPANIRLLINEDTPQYWLVVATLAFFLVAGIAMYLAV